MKLEISPRGGHGPLAPRWHHPCCLVYQKAQNMATFHISQTKDRGGQAKWDLGTNIVSGPIKLNP